MKKIIYTDTDGRLCVVTPAEGARLAYSITLADGRKLLAEPNPVTVDTIMRAWPVRGAVAEWAETEDKFVARIRAKDVPADALDVRIVDGTAIPTDRTFRNAWKAGANGVEHDMEKCREIHKDHLRVMRTPKLAALDVEYMRADERADTEEKRRIAALKQTLRDVTSDPAIAAAATPEELKAFMPAILL